MKVLAIDQSFTSCGIVILNDQEVEYAEKYVSDPAKDMFARAWEVAEHILYVHQQHQPEYVAIEELAFNAIGNQTRNLAGLQYTIITRLRYVEGKDIRVVHPTSVKKIATGRGNAKKDELLEFLPKQALNYFLSLGVKKTTGLRDLCDAYWIGQAAIQG